MTSNLNSSSCHCIIWVDCPGPEFIICSDQWSCPSCGWMSSHLERLVSCWELVNQSNLFSNVVSSLTHYSTKIHTNRKQKLQLCVVKLPYIWVWDQILWSSKDDFISSVVLATAWLQYLLFFQSVFLIFYGYIHGGVWLLFRIFISCIIVYHHHNNPKYKSQCSPNTVCHYSPQCNQKPLFPRVTIKPITVYL